jgi:hypothetical protein
VIIKTADDKSATLDALARLLDHPGATAAIKKNIEIQIRNIKAGARNEADVAFDMAHHYAGGDNWMVIHDLRVVHDGEAAQIDHLVINRLLEAWVCESKSFSEGIAIDERGGFTSFYGSKPFAIPSPIEQNRRHVTILKRLFDDQVVALPKRLGFTLKPNLRSLVLVSNRARITFPKTPVPGMESVIKSEQFRNTTSKAIDDASPLAVAKFVGKDTLRSLAEEIAKLHVPIEFDWHARFGLAKPTTLPLSQRKPPEAPAGTKPLAASRKSPRPPKPRRPSQNKS